MKQIYRQKVLQVKEMDVDSDILEVAVLDNEFDESFEEGKQIDHDQDEEMEAAEAEGNARFSAKQNADDDEVNNDGIKEDLRSKINGNRLRENMQDDDGMSRNRKEEETDFRKRDYGKCEFTCTIVMEDKNKMHFKGRKRKTKTE